MSTQVNYKGSQLTTINNSATKTLATKGTWMEDDIEIIDTTPTGSITTPFEYSLNSMQGRLDITVSNTAGYIEAGNTTQTYALNVVPIAQRTITPGTTNQTISGGQLIPSDGITVEGDADLVASNIISTANIFGVQGAVSIQNFYTGTSTPSSSLGSNGDIYLITSK